MSWCDLATVLPRREIRSSLVKNSTSSSKELFENDFQVFSTGGVTTSRCIQRRSRIIILVRIEPRKLVAQKSKGGRSSKHEFLHFRASPSSTHWLHATFTTDQKLLSQEETLHTLDGEGSLFQWADCMWPILFVFCKQHILCLQCHD